LTITSFGIKSLCMKRKATGADKAAIGKPLLQLAASRKILSF
jgi:hypothetical protein